MQSPTRPGSCGYNPTTSRSHDYAPLLSGSRHPKPWYTRFCSRPKNFRVELRSRLVMPCACVLQGRLSPPNPHDPVPLFSTRLSADGRQVQTLVFSTQMPLNHLTCCWAMRTKELASSSGPLDHQLAQYHLVAKLGNAHGPGGDRH